MKTVIRQNVDLAKAPAHAQDIFDYAPASNGARDYEDVAYLLAFILQITCYAKVAT